MQNTAYDLNAVEYSVPTYRFGNHADNDNMRCKWSMLRAQLLMQWQRLSAQDIDGAGPSRHKLAMLIQGRYGIASELVENYLRNFERTLPVI